MARASTDFPVPLSPSSRMVAGVAAALKARSMTFCMAGSTVVRSIVSMSVKTPSYGHPKDRRTDLLQVQAGIAAASDGGIPVYARAYSGGAAEISQVTEIGRAHV